MAIRRAISPLCQQPSERVHGAYVRTVADLLCAGRLVILSLTVRKFVCGTSTCPRRIFTERLPDLVQSYARLSNRLREALQALGFATCGQMSERLAPKLGMQVSGPTLLRHMRTVSIPPPASVRILGIDDWAWKKGQTYGTILVDLEKRIPIDLLPDRSKELMDRKQSCLPEVEEHASDGIPAKAQGIKDTSVSAKAGPQAETEPEKHYRTIPPYPYQ